MNLERATDFNAVVLDFIAAGTPAA
jgi:hypothetical protein